MTILIYLIWIKSPQKYVLLLIHSCLVSVLKSSQPFKGLRITTVCNGQDIDFHSIANAIVVSL
jgi:hypothetical protein